MEFLINYWYVAVLAVIALLGVVFGVYKLSKSTTNEQFAMLNSWLVWAVTEAETYFGSGTGSLKLNYVYNLFVTKFPTLALLISYETIAELVDVALDEMKEMLTNNEKIASIVYGEEETDEETDEIEESEEVF